MKNGSVDLGGLPQALPHSVRTGYPHAHTRRKDTNTTAHSNMTDGAPRRARARGTEGTMRYLGNGVGDPSTGRVTIGLVMKGNYTVL